MSYDDSLAQVAAVSDDSTPALYAHSAPSMSSGIEATAAQPFPLPRPALPAWLLTAQVRQTPEQLARLDEALAAVDDQGRWVHPIPSRDCRAGR